MVITCVPHGMLRFASSGLLYRPDTHSRRQSHTSPSPDFGSSHNGWRGVLDLRHGRKLYTRPPLRRMASASPMARFSDEYAHRCDPAAHQCSDRWRPAANSVGVQQLQLFIAVAFPVSFCSSSVASCLSFIATNRPRDDSRSQSDNV